VFANKTQGALQTFITSPPPPTGSIRSEAPVRLPSTLPGAFPDVGEERHHDYCIEEVFSDDDPRVCAHSSRPIDPIEQLPPELQLRVFASLDYQSLIMLSMVSRHYNSAVNLRDRPLAEKDDFVKEQQKKKKHNLCFVDLKDDDVNFQWNANGFACYSCHRVLPFTAFSQRQVRKYHYKNSRKEGQVGFRRRCLACATAADLYRARTLITFALSMFTLKRHNGHLPQFLYDADYFYCARCKELVRCHEWNSSSICQQCGDRARKDEIHNVILRDDHRTLDCRQCGQASRLDRQNMPCKYCNGPICEYCGRVVTDTGRWWCGRACSQEGYKFCRKAGRQWQSIKPKLWEVMSEKTESRKVWSSRTRVDLLDIDCGENILELLFGMELAGTPPN
jgi:hypothetical protein